MISVCVPVGNNRERNLNLVLYSLTRQTFRDFEVIVVTDAREPGGVLDVCAKYNKKLDLRAYVNRLSPKVNLGAYNRNMAADRADFGFFVFLDSGVVLHPSAMWYYAEGFTNFPNRAILGVYHWLPPWNVREEDVNEWDGLTRLPFEIPKEPGCRWGPDPRWEDFQKTGPDRLYCDYKRALHILGGNFGVSRRCFEHVGGFWTELTRGIDGAFGLAFMQAGFSWSYDKRIVGLHLYHEAEAEAFQEDPSPKTIARFHSDESWLGQMKEDKGWPWIE